MPHCTTQINSRVRRVSIADGTRIITTVAGNGACCAGGDGGAATNAPLHFPTSLAFDTGDNMYIVDNVSTWYTLTLCIERAMQYYYQYRINPLHLAPRYVCRVARKCCAHGVSRVNYYYDAYWNWDADATSAW